MSGDATSEAIWSHPGEGEHLWFLGTLATVRVPGEAVAGRFALIEFLFPHNTSPPQHTHPQDASYVVLDRHPTIPAGHPPFSLPPRRPPLPPSRLAPPPPAHPPTPRLPPPRP